MRIVLWTVFGLGAAFFAFLIWTDSRTGAGVDPAETSGRMIAPAVAAELALFRSEAENALEAGDAAPASAEVPEKPAPVPAGSDPETGAKALKRLTTMVDMLHRACPSRINGEEWLYAVRIDADGLVRQVYWIESETRDSTADGAAEFAQAFVAEQRPKLLKAYRATRGIYRNAREAGRGMRFEYLDSKGMRLAAIELRPEEL